MKHLHHILLAAAAAMLVGACSEAAPPAAEPEEPQPNVFKPLTDTLDRARGVQDTVLQQAEDLRRQIDEAEGAQPER